MACGRMRSRNHATRRRALLLVPALLASACAALTPTRVTTQQRLAAFPTGQLPLERAVTVRWNRYGVPWIEAQTDLDLAFTLGLVHAHLRLGQIAVAKRIVQGRLSESAGPFTGQIDRLLRTIDFGYAGADSELRMSPATHAWMQAFVDGLNWYQQHAANRPPEYGLLGLKDEPWTIRDLLAIGRLAGTDVNWLVDSRLMQARLGPTVAPVAAGARGGRRFDSQLRFDERAGDAVRSAGGLQPFGQQRRCGGACTQRKRRGASRLGPSPGNGAAQLLDSGRPEVADLSRSRPDAAGPADPRARPQ